MSKGRRACICPKPSAAHRHSRAQDVSSPEDDPHIAEDENGAVLQYDRSGDPFLSAIEKRSVLAGQVFEHGRLALDGQGGVTAGHGGVIDLNRRGRIAAENVLAFKDRKFFASDLQNGHALPRCSLLHVPTERVTETVNRPHESRLASIVAENRAQFGDETRKVALLDECLRPHCVAQRLLRNRTGTVLDQDAQEREGLRREMHRRTGIEQRAALEIELESIERSVSHGGSSLSRAQTPSPGHPLPASGARGSRRGSTARSFSPRQRGEGAEGG